MTTQKHAFFALLFLLSILTVACTPQVATRGNLLEDFRLKEIAPGLDTKEDVVRKIGSPTTVAPFDENTWYYMGQRTEKKGILDPKVTQERIVTITFDATDGKVMKVAENKNGRENIPVAQKTTPVSGNDFTFLQQMLGNLGKFNKQPESAARTAGGDM